MVFVSLSRCCCCLSSSSFHVVAVSVLGSRFIVSWNLFGHSTWILGNDILGSPCPSQVCELLSICNYDELELTREVYCLVAGSMDSLQFAWISMRDQNLVTSFSAIACKGHGVDLYEPSKFGYLAPSNCLHRIWNYFTIVNTTSVEKHTINFRTGLRGKVEWFPKRLWSIIHSFSVFSLVLHRGGYFYGQCFAHLVLQLCIRRIIMDTTHLHIIIITSFIRRWNRSKVRKIRRPHVLWAYPATLALQNKASRGKQSSHQCRNPCKIKCPELAT